MLIITNLKEEEDTLLFNYILAHKLSDTKNLNLYGMFSSSNKVVTDSIVSLNLKTYLEQENLSISLQELVNHNENLIYNLLYKTDKNFILSYLKFISEYSYFPEQAIKDEENILFKRGYKMPMSVVHRFYENIIYKNTYKNLEYTLDKEILYNSVSIECNTKLSINKKVGRLITCKELLLLPNNKIKSRYLKEGVWI